MSIAQAALLMCYAISSLIISNRAGWSTPYRLLVFIAGAIPFAFLAINKQIKYDAALTARQ
ncbi:hypothetical protein ACFL2V_12350 [Pseudomonadota bacterium]